MATHGSPPIVQAIAKGFKVPGMELTRIYPEWVYGDREWLSCLMILDCRVLRSKGIVDTYVDFERQRIKVAELLQDMRPWSTGERLLVQVAIDLFNGDGNVHFKDLVDLLDTSGFKVVTAALGVYRPDIRGQ